MPKIILLKRHKLVEFVQTLHQSGEFSFKVATLLGGDRLSCCDEAVAVQVGSEIAGVATIAPQGEQLSGQPTIVGLYVRPAFRQQGLGKQLMKAVVKRCVSRGFTHIRVDVMSEYAMKTIQALPQELKGVLDIHDCGNIMDHMPG